MPTDSLETLSAADAAASAGGIAVDGGHGFAGAGAALEARLYYDPEVAALEQAAIFERTWQLAGHVSDLPEPGSYVTASAGSQSVIVIRGKDGELRAFRNVCRHRGRAADRRAVRLLAGDPLRLPRLDLRPRRQAARRSRAAQLPGRHRPLQPRPPRRQGGGASAGSSSSTSTPMPTPLAELLGDLPQRLEPLRHPLAGPGERRRRPPPERQLEDRRRQLPRGLPRADRPPGPDAPARLRALRRRRPRELRLVRGADARRAIGEPHRAPLPAAGAADGEARPRPTATSGASSSSTPTRRSTSIPTRSAGGRSTPTVPSAPATRSRCFAPARRAFATASSAGSTTASTTSSAKRTWSWSRRSRTASRRPATAAAR